MDDEHRTEFPDRMQAPRFQRAIKEGDAETVAELISFVDLNEPDWENGGRLALHEAVARRQLDVICTLIACERCNAGVRNCQGQNALHVALSTWPFDEMVVKMLIEAGCDADSQELSTGLTPLHILIRQAAHAKSNDDRALVSSLIKAMVANKRCDVNKRNARGETAAHLAASIAADFSTPIDILVEAGIDLNAKNDCGETPLMQAVDHGNVDVVRMLVQKGASGDERNRYMQTALHYAANRNAHAAAATLVDGGSDVNITDLNGDTPLHIAAGKGFLLSVEVLLKAPNINVFIRNKQSKQPLDVVIESGFQNVVQLIQRHIESTTSMSASSDECVTFRHPEKLLRPRTASADQRRTAIHNGVILSH